MGRQEETNKFDIPIQTRTHKPTLIHEIPTETENFPLMLPQFAIGNPLSSVVLNNLILPSPLAAAT